MNAKTVQDIEPFRALVERDQRERFKRDHYGETPEAIASFEERCTRACTAHIHLGKKFARVDVGTSGAFMVDMETGEIFGIKGYGTVHRGHRYGTLDTIHDWYWGEYSPQRKAVTA